MHAPLSFSRARTVVLLALAAAVLALAGCRLSPNTASYNSLNPGAEQPAKLWLGNVDDMRQDLLLILEHHYLDPIEEQGLRFLIEAPDFTLEAELEPRETPTQDGGLVTAYAVRLSVVSKKKEQRNKLAEVQADLENAFAEKYTVRTVARMAPVQEAQPPQHAAPAEEAPAPQETPSDSAPLKE